MVLIDNKLIPASITVGEIKELQQSVKGLTIMNWKKTVKAFAVEKGISDQEAIACVNCKL